MPPRSFYVKDDQYKEYERSANAAGYVTVPPADERSNLTCLVNPCNPTGKYMPIEELKAYISDNVPDGSHVIVDESMQLWHSAGWREDSLVSQRDWIKSGRLEFQKCTATLCATQLFTVTVLIF